MTIFDWASCFTIKWGKRFLCNVITNEQFFSPLIVQQTQLLAPSKSKMKKTVWQQICECVAINQSTGHHCVSGYKLLVSVVLPELKVEHMHFYGKICSSETKLTVLMICWCFLEITNVCIALYIRRVQDSHWRLWVFDSCLTSQRGWVMRLLTAIAYIMCFLPH